jgi:hypothetical protein
MNSEFHDLEKELGQYKPRSASPLLKERVRTGLARASKRPVLVLPVVLRFAAAAVALVALLTVFVLHEQRGGDLSAVSDGSPALPEDFQAVSARRYLLRQDDEGIVVLEGYGPVRKTRYHTLEHVEWRHPGRDQHYFVTRPRQQVVLAKLEMN